MVYTLEKRYICIMKKILFITGLFISILLFAPSTAVNTYIASADTTAAIVKEKSDAGEMRYSIATIGKDTRSSNTLTARRSVQSVSLTSETRSVEGSIRTIQDLWIKRAERLYKVSEFVSRLQTINHSALLTRMGYRVYALREIII